MSIPKVTLELREGETFRRRLRYLDSRKKPIDLTGAVVRIQFREKPDGPLLLDMTVISGHLTVTPLLGQIDIVISATETAAFTFKRASWDCRIQAPSGDVKYIVEGPVLLVRSTTE